LTNLFTRSPGESSGQTIRLVRAGLSPKVPKAAVTSIIGISVLLGQVKLDGRSAAIVRDGGARDVARPGEQARNATTFGDLLEL
jgi:hypothetical protein